MSFTKQSNSQALFGGSFYIEAKLSYTKDPKNKQFTVTVDGVRGYSKYEWNFGTNITMYLQEGDDTNKRTVATKKTDTKKAPKLPSSGSNTYKGWIPESGYHTDVKLSRTFNYKSDGTVPKVVFYLKGYNSSITWINKNKTVSALTEATHDISSSIGTLDVSAPTFTLTNDTETKTTIGFIATATNNYEVNKWEVTVDGTSKTYENASYKTKLSDTYKTTTNGDHTISVRARNAYNNVWSGWKHIYPDNYIPSITKVSIVPTAPNKVTVNFTTNCASTWKLTGDGINYSCPTQVKSNGDDVSQTNVTVVNNSIKDYTIELTRVKNGIKNSKLVSNVNTTLPVLTFDKVDSIGNTIKCEVSANKICKDWQLKVMQGNTQVATQNLTSLNNTYGGNFSLTNLQMNTPYSLVLSAKGSDNSLSSSITKSSVMCIGCVHICTENNKPPVMASVFIYSNSKKKFIGAVPYIYDENYDNKSYTDDRKHWRQCT